MTALAAAPDPPCSEQTIARMRALDIASSYIQSVGYEENNRLLCSSLGLHGEGYALGEPSPAGPSGIRAWLGVDLAALVPGHRFNLYGRDGFVAIVHPDLALDIAGRQATLGMRVLLNEPRQVLQTRGSWPAESALQVDVLVDGARLVDGWLVVTRVSPGTNVAVMAARPAAVLDRQVRAQALVMAPVGLAAGLLLAAVVYLYVRAQMTLVAALRAALRGREFHLVYQPLVELDSGRCVGAEALVRWRRRDGQDIRPDVFIEAAEEAGLIRQLTAQVFDLVADDFAPLLRSHPELHVGINVSSEDLQSAETVELVRELIERSGARANNFLIEATERGFLHADRARQVVSEIRALGVRVAIDDFGTGYSSLAYLERFELDFLKIDKSFVDTLNVDAATSQVALHIIEMAKSLRLQTIAEGVETQPQADVLRGRGVRYAQGWLFGRPMPIEAFAQFLGAQVDGRAGAAEPAGE
jgi:sensor c-di-GMP phosphodiesterase-like protein